MLILIVGGPHEGEVLELDSDGPVLLGRQGAVPLSDSSVSPHHASLQHEGGQWYIDDLSSANGTYVNHVRVIDPTPVRDGDTVRLGRTTMILTRLNGAPMCPRPLMLPPPDAENANQIVVRRLEPLGPVHAPQPYDFESSGRWMAMRRWLPAMILAVLLLVVAAHAMLFLRSQQAVDDLRAELGKQDRDDVELLSAIERQLNHQTQSDRVFMIQEVANLLASRDEERLRQLEQRLEARLPVPQPAGTAPPASASAGSPAPDASAGLRILEFTGNRAPAARQRSRVSVIFLIDASSALAEAMPQVYDELSHEISRLGQSNTVGVMLLERGRLLEFPGTLLRDLDRRQISWSNTLLADRSGSVVDHGACDLSAALQLTLRHAPEQLFIFSDTLGEGSDAQRQSLRESLQALNRDAATRIHTIQFFSRTARESLRAIAQEHRGTYSYVPPGKN